MSKGTPYLDKTPSPQHILDRFAGYFDPCPLNPTWDGLSIQWASKNYVNPPYSNKEPWIQKAIYEMARGNLTVMLLPATTDLAWFHDLILRYATSIEWIRGRLKFDRFEARTGSMLVYFEP